MRKAIESVNNTEQKSKGCKQEIKSLPAVFTCEADFRAYIALAVTLSDMDKADAYNDTLTANKLLTVKQSVDNYKANGIDLEHEFYPVAVNIGGLFCGINRRQRTIFAVGFVGNNKFAFTISTRANKILPELEHNEKVGEKYGYAPKYLARLDANNGTLLPAAIDFGHFIENNFGLPYCYSTKADDLEDFAQWLNNAQAFEQYKKLAAEFENVNYDAENVISEFVKTAENSGFAVFRQDNMKIAFDYASYLQGVIDGENYSTTQKEKARAMLYGDKVKQVKLDKKSAKKTA